jgi:hypothetical protein
MYELEQEDNVVDQEGKLVVLNEILQRDFNTGFNNWLSFTTSYGTRVTLKTLHVLWQLIDIANRNNSDLIDMSQKALIDEAFNGDCSMSQIE